jgi:hypothetical protein
MPYALCPMPYALCPWVPHLSEKGYIDHTWRSLGYVIAPSEGKVQNKQVE